MNEMGGACSANEGRENVYKPEVQRPLGRPRRRWEKSIKCIFKKKDGRAWSGLICLRIGKSA
jgi:hypothetical protein